MSADVTSLPFTPPTIEPSPASAGVHVLGPREVIVIDTSLPDFETLRETIGVDAPDAEVLLLDATRDAFDQIGERLAAGEPVSAIHLVAHGQVGQFVIRGAVIDASELARRAAQLQVWNLDDGADILLYGCDIASGPNGEAFVRMLASLTGADVAASSNLTGHSTLGGDWTLEVATGVVEAPALAMPTWTHVLNLVANNGETRAHTNTAAVQTTTPWGGGNVAADADGNFVVTWTDDRGGTNDVYARVFDKNGSPQSAEFRVNTTTASAQEWPMAAMDVDGDFVVSWLSNASGDWDVYFRRYDSAGTALSAETLVNTTTAGAQDAAAIAMADDGSFVVTWTDFTVNSGDVLFQRYDATGTAQGANTVANSTTLGAQQYSDIAVDSDGDFVVVWESDNQDLPATWGIFGQRFNAAGIAQGAEFRVNTATAGDQVVPEIAMASDGSFVVTWEDSVADGSGRAVLAQRFDATGTKLGVAFQVNTETSGDQWQANVDMEAGGSFLIAWQSDSGQDGGGKGIYARHYAADGTALGGEVLVNTTTASDQDLPSVAVADDDAVVVWQGNGPGDSSGVFFQQYSALLPTTTIAVDTTSDVSDGDTSSFLALLVDKGADGFISLREAIEAANGQVGTDTITFAISGTGTHTIVVGSALPNITDAAILDGSTDDSFAANGNAPAIVIDGNGLAADGLVLAIGSGGSTIRGLVIRDFGTTAAHDGIEIQSGSDGNTIAGNYVGQLTTGGSNAGAGEGNAGSGIRVASANNTIGGSGSSDRNVISGNTGHGIHLAGTGNTVAGNIIGLDASGSVTLGNGDDGVSIRFGADNNLIGGTTAAARNIISANGRGVLIIDNTTGNTVSGNYIGTDITGELDRGNSLAGVEINGSSGNTVGGGSVSARNVISGNDIGIYLNAADSNTIAFNYIGTDDDGVQAVGNAFDGISVTDSSNNTIGGVGVGNLISGNGGDGILMTGATSSGNVIRSNLIGTTAAGTTVLGNGSEGITLQGVAGTQIGGTAAGAGNVIAGSGAEGIWIIDGATGTRVEGNVIGTDTTGTIDLGNGAGGIRIGNVGGPASGNWIGGITAEAGNVIAFNNEVGVGVDQTAAGASVDNPILGNRIYGNDDLGIDLDGLYSTPSSAGVTPNDVGDPDTGGNDRLNFPVLTTATSDANGTAIVGSLGAEAGTTYRIEFFATRPTLADTTNGEGERFLGAISVTTDGSGTASVSTTLTGVWVNSGDRISATATEDLGGGSFGSTSEFSGNVVATSVGIVVVDTLSDVGDGTVTSIAALGNARGADGRISLREAIDATNNTSNGASADKIVFAIPTALVGGVHTVSVTSALPTILDAVTIDGTSEPDFSGTPMIELDGTGAGGSVNGLLLGSGSGSSTVRGLTINRFSASGIRIESNGNTIAGNHLGTDTSGTVDLGNGHSGVIIYGSSNTIGGSATADRNVISGNNGYGVVIDTGFAGGNTNVIAGNRIGTNAAGTAALGNTFNGVFLGGTGNRVGGTISGEGNLISGNGDIGLRIDGATGTIVQGNRIGTNAAGTAAIANANGIRLAFGTTGTIIGGTVPEARNVISGNAGAGIAIDDSTTTSVLGNYIGTDGSGLVALGNTGSGVSIQNGSHTNAIGGSGANEGNVISANGYVGILIADDGSDDNTIQGNLIGTDKDGVGDLGNGSVGISLFQGPDGTLVGGARNTGARNVIAFNGDTGIYISGATTQDNEVRGNYIGVLSDGTTAAGNTYSGIDLRDGTTGNVIGGTGNHDGNVIGRNGTEGVLVTGSATTGNALLRNLVFGNGIVLGTNYSLGINLIAGTDTGLGITANDIDATAPYAHDTDSGPNDLQNFPVLFTASVGGTDLSITGELRSAASTSYRVEFFVSALGTEDSSGHGEGATYLGSASVTTDGDGYAALLVLLGSVSVAAGDRVTATATVDLGGGLYGSTSEFAMNLPATVNSAPVVANAGIPGSVSFTEQSPVAVSSLFTVTDADSATLTGATLTISGNYAAGSDVLQYTTMLGISGTWNAGTGVLTLSGSASTADYQTAVRSVAFYNGSDAPSALQRTVTITATDGTDTSNTLTRLIDVTLQNDSPTAAAGGPYTIAEGASLPLSATGSADPDGDTLTYAWDLDNDGNFGETGEPLTASPTVSWSTLQSFGIDDDGTYTIGLAVNDGTVTVTTTATVTVTNTAPTLSVSGASSASSGHAYTLSLGASDPGNDTITGWTIDWGDGTFETVAGNPTSVTHTYTRPGFTFNVTASATDEDGTHFDNELLVPAWSGSDAVHRYEGSVGAFVGTMATGQNDHVEAIVGPDGSIYVSALGSGDIVRYQQNGTLVGTFVAAGSGGLAGPAGMAFGADGHLYVTDFSTGNVLRFHGTTGAFIDTFVAAGSGGLSGGLGIAFGPDGDLYVASRGTASVLRFDGTTGAHDATFVFTSPVGMIEDIAFGPDGNLYVADFTGQVIRRYAATTGTFLGNFVTAGSGGLVSPAGLAFGPDGHLYVTDQGTSTVLKFDGSTGAFLGTHVATGTGGLSSPAYPGFAPNEQVLVVSNTLIVDTATDNNDAGIVAGNLSHTISWLNANKGADGFVSLREALIAANNTVNAGIPDVIDFDIAGSGPQSITLLSALPTITDGVTIDGTSDPDFAGTPVVLLDGSLAGSNVDGLRFDTDADGSTVRGLAIHRFSGFGVSAVGSSGDMLANLTIAGNHIGTDASGTVSAGYGNVRDGIGLYYTQDATIGGINPEDRNLIAGNGSLLGYTGGINVGSSSVGAVIQGNYIGLDATGTVVLGNGQYGVLVDQGASDIMIGGTVTAAANRIAGAQVGVEIANSGATTSGVAILGNRIFGNSALGIDLGVNGANGVTPNDNLDADGGPNSLQNHPTLVSANSGAGNTTIMGSLHSAAGTAYRIEFFSSPTGDASGYGEGAVYLGFEDVTTDGSGNASFTAVLGSVTLTAGHTVSATATVDLGGGSYGSTSEFAANVVVTVLPVVTTTGTTVAYTENDPATAVDAGVTVSDDDSANLTGATLTISANYASGQDVLAFTDQSGITGSWNAGTGVLTLSGSATIAQYQTALRSITYANTSDTPSTATRTVSFIVNDGSGNSASATRQIAVTSVNDAPTSVIFDVDDGSALRLNTTTAGDQAQPALTALPGGGRVAVWTSVGQDGDGGGIYGQRFDAQGQTLGSEFRVNANSTRYQSHASAATFSDGSFVVGWSEMQAGVAAWVEARVFAADGTPLTGDLSISVPLSNLDEGYAPQVQVIGPDRWAVIWSNEVSGASRNVVGQIFDRSGTAQTARFTVGSSGSAPDSWAVVPRVTALDDGGMAVVWSHYDTPTQTTTRVQFVNADGSLRGAFTPLGSTDSADITQLADGRVVATSHSQAGILYATVFASSGAMLVPNFAVTTVYDGTTWPRLAASGDGFAVAFTRQSADGLSTEIVVQRYDAAITPIGEATLARLEADAAVADIALTTLADGSAMLGWRADGVDGSGQGAYAGVLRAAVREGASIGTAVATVIDVLDPESGDTHTFSLTNSAGGRFAIDSLTGRITVANGTLLDHEAAASHDIVVRVTDGSSAWVERTLTILVENVNEAPTGTPLIAGATVVGQTLSADTSGIADGDGLGAYSYQWIRGGVDVVGAIASTYLLTAGDLGNSISVRVSYIDGHGETESLTSTAVGPVTAANSSPVFASLDGTPVYSENGAAVVLDGNVTVSDAELGGVGHFNGATLSLSRNGGANAQDVFSATGTLGALTPGGSLVVGGTTIGTVTSNGSGTLLLSFNASATNSLVNAAMQQLAYANSSDAPPASVQIDWTFDDGNTGAQGSGGALQALGGITVTISATNDVPVVTATGTTLTYTENAAATAVDGALTVTDADNANLVSATVSISANYASGQDVLAFTDQNGITGNWNAGTGVLTLSGSATVAQYQAALRSITYINTSDAPSAATRTVSFAVNDGTASSTAATRNITVAAINDLPVITSDGGGASAAVTVSENTTAVTTVTSSDLDGGSAVYSIVAGGDGALFVIHATTGALTFATTPDFEAPADSNGDNLYDVTVQVSDGLGAIDTQAIVVTVANAVDPGFTVSAISGATTEGGGTASFTVVLDVATTADVTISIATGDASEGSVSTSLLTFTSANWNVAQTVVVTGVDDGLDDGDIAYTIVTGIAVSADTGYGGLAVADVSVTNTDDDSTPVNSVPPTVTLAEDTPFAFTGADTLAVTDIDGNLQTVSLDVLFGTLSVTLAGGVTVSSGTVGTAAFSLSGSLIPLNATLASLAYTPDGDFSGTDTLSIVSADALGLSDTDTVALSVSPVDDAPVLTGLSISVAQGASITLAPADFSISDPDGQGGTRFVDVRNVTGGAFELSSAPGVPVSTFAFTDVAAGLVRFLHSGAATAPSFEASVRDSIAAGSFVAASVGFTPTPVVVTPVPSPTTPPPELVYSIVLTNPDPPPPTTPAPPATPSSPPTTAPPSRPGDDADASATAAREPGEIDPRVLMTMATPRTPPTSPGVAPESSAAPAAPAASLQPGVSVASGVSVATPLPTAIVTPAPIDTPAPVTPVWQAWGIATPLSVDLPPAQDGAETHEKSEEERQFEIMVNGVRLAGMSLSVGVVTWALRAAGILSSLLASLPAWRYIDPLPVLERAGRSKVVWRADEDDQPSDEDQAVEEMLESKH